MYEFDRKSHLLRLEKDEYDLLIIGGGITGACLAYDATTRGIRTALIDKLDFGHATSSASSKLLHGGMRYLQQLRFDKLRESAFERIYFQNLAPHLCKYVPFLVPTFRGLKNGKIFLGAGAAAYTALSVGQNARACRADIKVSPPEFIDRTQVLSKIPWLGTDWRGTGALVFPECHMKSSERMTLALIRAAADEGAAVANYVRAEGMETTGGRVGPVSIVTDDGSRFKINAKTVANCTGPWIGEFDNSETGRRRSPVSSYFRGSHLVLKDLQLDCALALPTPQKIQGVTGRGGRHVFLIPWRNRVLLGTSYAPHNTEIDRVVPTEEDAEQLLDAVNASLGKSVLTPDHIEHAFSGIYPITVSNVKSDEYQGASDFIVTDHGRSGGTRGYFSIFGAKYTTARKLAEIACNAIAGQLDMKTRKCITRQSTIPVADISDAQSYCKNIAQQYSADVGIETIHHLHDNFGRDLEEVLQVANGTPQQFDRICSHRDNISAEAVFSARREMVVHLDDFIFRRTGLGTIGNPGRAAIERCAELIGDELGWSARRKDTEVDLVISKFPNIGAVTS